jgi:hypothetical protein
MAGETEVFGENLPKFHFSHHRFHMTEPGIQHWQSWWEFGTSRLSYSTDIMRSYYTAKVYGGKTD